MSSLNSCLLEGNLTNDVEFLELTTGGCVAKFSIASNRWYRDSNKEFQQDTIFIRVETWGKLAEACRDNLVKGNTVKVAGELRQSSWLEPDGTKRERDFIKADYVDFRQPKKKVSSEEVGFTQDFEETEEKPKRKRK